MAHFLKGIVVVFVSLLWLNGRDWSPISAGAVSGLGLASFVWCLIVSIGLVLVYVGRRVPALRPGTWGGVFILTGTILGSVVSICVVSYQRICCMFAYNISSGYPFVAITRTLTVDSYMPWSQVYAHMQNYPGQIYWDVSWISLILNSLFYAYASVILIIALRFVLHSSSLWPKKA